MSGSENALKLLDIQCILSFLFLAVKRFLDLILQANKDSNEELSCTVILIIVSSDSEFFHHSTFK